MDANICCCGAFASYPHSPTCPFPYYGMDDGLIKDWQIRERALRVVREHQPRQDQFTLPKFGHDYIR